MNSGDVSMADILAVIEGLKQQPIDAPALVHELDSTLASLIARHQSETHQDNV